MPSWGETSSSDRILSLQYSEHSSCTVPTCDGLCNDPMRRVIIPISQMGKQAYQRCVTCPGPQSRKTETQVCLTGKSGILFRMSPRLLSGWGCGGFLEPASPPFLLAQSTGCRLHPSPLSHLLGLGCPRDCPLGPQSFRSMPSIASLPCGPAPGPWPHVQPGVAMAMPYPWSALWAPQATGMSSKSHPSGQHPNSLSHTATLITSSKETFSDRVPTSSLENRWPPL